MMQVSRYLSLVKFSHTVFALPFALIGYFLGLQAAGTGFDTLLLIKVVGCMVTARTSAMAFNRFADRSFDQLNERTRNREVPSGAIKASSAMWLTIISAAGFIVITYSINTICFFLSPVALAVILGYSFTKRYTSLCHLILGLGLSLAPIGAYLAVTGHFAILPLLFSVAVLSWVGGFDIIYSLQDDTFDRSQKLHSLPASFGRRKALTVSSLLHVLCAGLLFTAGIEGASGIYYWAGFALFCLLLVYQHRLVHPEDLTKVDVAFFTTNGIASLVFAAFVIADILIYNSFRF